MATQNTTNNNATSPFAETPSGTVNGSNAVFILANTPVHSSNVIVVLDGITQRNGTDYIVSGTSITFSGAPAAGTEIFAYYNTLNNSGAFTLTTTGSSGASTYTGGILNIPQYGGGGGDLLSTLTNAEISITAATTATISRMHVVSGTTSNYTVMLPAASGNAGKLIGIRIAPTATKLFTIDGNASETIDGSLVRIMWAGESCLLLCDGSNWFKVAGKSIPMDVLLKRTISDQTGIASTTHTQIVMDTLSKGTSLLYDSTNGRVSIVRPGTYLCSAFIYATNISTYAYIELGLNSLPNPNGVSQSTPVGGGISGSFTTSFDCVVGDAIKTNIYGDSAGTITVINGAPANLSVTEILKW